LSMRAAPELFVEWVDNEAVVLDPKSGQVHYLNPSAAIVYASILEQGFEPAIADLERRHGGAEGFADELPVLLEELKEKGLLLDD
jgi:hypothetical protein